MDPFPKLFSPFKLGKVELKNRLVMLPMGTRMARKGIVSDDDIAWHAERARGGVALIITGGTVVHPSSVLRGGFLVEAFNDAGAPALRRRADAIHAHNCKVFGQLLHLGRESVGVPTDAAPVAPSPRRSPRDPYPPHELTDDEIRQLVTAFGHSAWNLKSAGYDGVEVHGGHGYLVAQFLSASANLRTDQYGCQSVESRTRFLAEVLREVRRRCGQGFPVGVRLSAEEEIPRGLTVSDTIEIVSHLKSAGLLDYVSVTVGVRNAYVKDLSFSHGFASDYAADVRRSCQLPVIVAGRIMHPEQAERIVANEDADLIGLGRALIADPEWPLKAGHAQVLQIRPCIGVLQECRTSQGAVTCAVNPKAGRELEWGDGTVAGSGARLRVVVVGGGPAGLEAARLAALQGHEVVLYEQDNALGGQIRVAARAPKRGELLRFIVFLEHAVRRLGVDLRLGVKATRDMVSRDNPNAVIVATGSRPSRPSIPGIELPHVLTARDLLEGAGDTELGRRAVVIDDGVGLWPSCSAAEYLAERGLKVEFVTSGPSVGARIPAESLGPLHARLNHEGVRIKTSSMLDSIDETGAWVVDRGSGGRQKIAAETIVVDAGNEVEDQLIGDFTGVVPQVVGIGDCVAPRQLTHAILDASRLAISVP